MSQPSLTSAPAEKQKTNVYTMMLILSFISLVTGCILLYIELNKYGAYPYWNTSSATPATAGS